jgi:threonine synthase
MSDDGSVFLLEQFHGPTCAFKDVALQFVGNLFDFFLQRRNARPSVG